MSAGLYEITVNALLDRGAVLGRTGWAAAAARVGHERVPALLVELTDAELIGDDVLPRAVADAWSGPARPTRRLDPEQWVELFAAAGYAEDGEPAARPPAPLRLHRGPDDDRTGMWWTGDGDRAAAETTLASPEALLARITDPDGRTGYVVDPSKLGAITAA